ncbi:MAG: hypothetical protein HUJ29_10635 [Gammaproteobacteria bacterium]|nr:hypothetical protein [Gammaproteobacteria bacterium]
MILEALQYIRTPCRAEFRKLGFLHEAIALQARHKRLHSLWGPHLERCKELIRKASRLCPQHRQVIVLGSGILSEIPLDFLARQFKQVVLVDAVHLNAVHDQVAGYGNVEMIESDITGLAVQLVAMKRRDRELPTPQPSIPGLCEETDLVISANLLSQLCVGPLHYAVPRFGFSNEQYIEWCRDIIDGHIGVLFESGIRTCLITDLVHVERDREGRELKREDMLFGSALPDGAWIWEWKLAPVGEVSRRYSVTAVVNGFVNFPYPGE